MDFLRFGLFSVGYCLLYQTWSTIGSTIDVDGWDYDHHHTKPEDWTGVCKLGRAQSPININTHETVKAKIQKPFIFHNYFEKTESTLRNNGHTLVMEFGAGGSSRKWINGGALPGNNFELRQAHFHWGSTGDQGSEHTINNRYSPMEMHLVHWNKDIAETYEEAVKHKSYNSLAVVAVNFKLGEMNSKLENFFLSTKKVRTQNQITNLEQGVILEDFLPDNTDKFFRYNGSLTTPGCNQIVVWTIFKERVEISQSQMDAFRRTTYIHEDEDSARFISNNYRPTQPLNGRRVLDIKLKSLKPHGNRKDKEKFNNSEDMKNKKGKMVNNKSLKNGGNAMITSMTKKYSMYFRLIVVIYFLY